MDNPEKKPVKEKRDWTDGGSLPYTRTPAFKAAFDCYKECLHRLRNVPVDSKPVAREVREKLMRIMVCIAHARLNIRVLPSLQEAMDDALEVQIALRILVESHGISIRDFALVSQYSASLVRQLAGWSTNEEQKSGGLKGMK